MSYVPESLRDICSVGIYRERTRVLTLPYYDIRNVVLGVDTRARTSLTCPWRSILCMALPSYMRYMVSVGIPYIC